MNKGHSTVESGQGDIGERGGRRDPLNGRDTYLGEREKKRKKKARL